MSEMPFATIGSVYFRGDRYYLVLKDLTQIGQAFMNKWAATWRLFDQGAVAVVTIHENHWSHYTKALLETQFGWDGKTVLDGNLVKF